MKCSLINCIFFFLLVLATSCQDQYNICEQNKLVEVNAGFYQKNGGVDVATAPTQLSMSVLGSSTPLYNQATNASKINFSLNPAIDSIKFTVKTATALPADTITIFYANRTIVLSAECGSISAFTITNTKTTTNVLDSIKIINPAVNNTLNIEHLKIYF
jgi:Family of unknown function (DUF6452)